MKESIDEYGKRMVEIVEKTREGFAMLVFHKVIAPTLKEWNIYIDWGMGCVSYHESDGTEIEEKDSRVREMIEKVERYCLDYDFLPQTHSGSMSELLYYFGASGKTNDKQEVCDWDKANFKYHTNPSTDGKKRTFGDLKKGDPVFIAEYEGGEVMRFYIKDIDTNEDGTLSFDLGRHGITGLNFGYFNDLTFKPGATRSRAIFIDEKKAEAYMELMFQFLGKYLNFPFAPHPGERLMELLS